VPEALRGDVSANQFVIPLFLAKHPLTRSKAAAERGNYSGGKKLTFQLHMLGRFDVNLYL
jgi:hypothetical protein